MAIGHYQKAMYDFGTAIRFDDKQAQYYANRGNCMLMLNQINEMTKKDPRIVYTDVAGVRELQFLDRPKSQLVLDAYYGA